VSESKDCRSWTVFCDIDGTIFPHMGDITQQHLLDLSPLPGVKEKWIEWDRKGYRIILVTGRRESVRKETEVQLSKSGIFYDTLLMGLSGGIRCLINDTKSSANHETAVAITLKRNEGMENVCI